MESRLSPPSQIHRPPAESLEESRAMSKILITGGSGYLGSVLTRKLLEAGHTVTNLDAQWFGLNLPADLNLVNFKLDTRSTTIDFNLFLVDTVIHLANVANDPAGDLNPALTWEVNALATSQLVATAKAAVVKQFIYASSGSVYGLSDSPKLTEDMPLVPLTAYNKSKMVAERVLLSYADQMAVQIIRPGTVCGVSPRQRLDITVNGMVAGACNKKTITVVGGKQIRPNIHIEDITDLIMWMLENPRLTGVWNAAFENLTGYEIAKLVGDYFEPLPVVEKTSADRRSYRMNSDKLLKAGFQPRFSVNDAIGDLVEAFISGKITQGDQCYNVNRMQRLGIA